MKKKLLATVLSAVMVISMMAGCGAAQAEQSAVVDVLLGAPGKPGNHNIIGMNPGDEIMMVSKDGGDVDAITASTITSRAFLRAVNAAYKSVFGYTAADGVSGASSQN